MEKTKKVARPQELPLYFPKLLKLLKSVEKTIQEVLSNPIGEVGGVPTDRDPSLWKIRAQLRLANHMY